MVTSTCAKEMTVKIGSLTFFGAVPGTGFKAVLDSHKGDSPN